MRVREIVWHRWLRRPYKLMVRDEGRGEPLVLLHGLGASGTIWQPFVKRLTPERWRIVIPDLLGFGESPRPDWKDYSVDDHARAIVYTLAKAGLKRRPITIVAHSMGCLIAIHIAVKYPKQVKRLILYAPPLFADDPVFSKHIRKKERYFAFFEYIATHPQLIILQHRWLWRLAKRTAGHGMTEERWLPFERSLRNTIMAQRAYQELVTTQVPTDIIHGRLDFVVIRTEIDKMVEANKNITLHKVTSMHNVTSIPVKYVLQLVEGKYEK